MTPKSIAAGETFIQAGQALDSFWYITEGSINACFPGGYVTLTKGDIIGICDFNKDSHFLSYTAASPAKVIPYGTPDVLAGTNYFLEHPDNMMLVALAMNRFAGNIAAAYASAYSNCQGLYEFLLQSYQEYHTLCGELHVVMKSLPGMSTLEALEESARPEEWQNFYYTGLHNVLSNRAMVPLIQENQLLPGFLHHAAADIHALLEKFQDIYDYLAEISHLLINEERLDLFDLYTGLYYRIGAQNPKSATLTDAIRTICAHTENQPGMDQTLIQSRIQEYQDRLQNMQKLMEHPAMTEVSRDFQGDYSLPGRLMDSVGIILDYADCFPEISSAFKNALAAYKQLDDKNDSGMEAARIRENLANCFYQVYAAAFQVSLMDDNVPVILKMFFNFGYVDAELCGMDNACYLYQVTQSYRGEPEHGIYTVYEWLKAIYDGEKEPSINEFEVDFEKHIQNLKTEGRLPAEAAERMKNDRAQKVLFELNNMFPRASKITSGRPAVFCPALSEHQFIRPPEDVLLYSDQIIKVINAIRDVDFTVFTRENITVLSSKENIHDFFHTEILPDIILMPVVGMRGSMWQEIVGRSRMTPARMMLPVFQLENLPKIVLRMVGEYRWEMCKRVQGARWNDVTYPSLTSLYYDYLQFYRKNNELSAETKEKIRTGLQKCKQNFKEYFLSDYMIYVLFESKGSPQLTKMARSILFKECPFPSAARKTLSANPIYKDLMEAHSRNAAERIRKLENLEKKLIAKKVPVPDSLYEEIEFAKK